MVLFLIAYYCSFNKRVVSRGMVIPEVFLVSRVGNHVMLCVYILALKVGTVIFHSPTLVLSQCTTPLPSLWLPCILILMLIPGVKSALFHII